MRQFFVSKITPIMEIVGDEAKHMMRVLRLKVNEEIEVVNSEGRAARSRIISGDSERVIAEFVEWNKHDSEPPIQITLAQALTKSDKFDYIVQKAVELGAAKIVPLATEHCVVKYDESKQKQKNIRWQKIAAEAAKQSRRTFITEVTSVMTLAELFTKVTPDQLVLFCYEQEDKQGVKELLRQTKAQKFLLIVGPEGGFSCQEAEFAKTSGAMPVSFGPRILRTETAATAALSVVMYECGDLGGPSCQK
jgi:16S rRNA (uracil1498-N3)-methyltransferase